MSLVPEDSEFGRAEGGGAKSLKVVRESLLLADVCILSKFWAICSLPASELADIEATEARRSRGLAGDRSDLGVLSPGGRDMIRVGKRRGVGGPVPDYTYVL